MERDALILFRLFPPSACAQKIPLMNGFQLHEEFRGSAPDPSLTWIHEPARWELGSGGLHLWTDSPTDFWQQTHYGFRVDNGHVLATAVPGNFVLATEVTFQPVHQYDQAGLMVRFSADCWLKCSVEFEEEGPSRLGCVVTNHGYSDWSTQDFPSDQRNISFQVQRVGPDFHVLYSLPGRPWSQMRITHLVEAAPESEPFCGIYACSPQGRGFHAVFHRLTVSAA